MRQKNRSFIITIRLLIGLVGILFVHILARLIYSATGTWHGFTIESFIEYTDNPVMVVATHSMGLLIGCGLFLVIVAIFMFIRAILYRNN